MIVATMTSWKGRINNVIRVLKSLKSQTKPLDRIYLNLSKTEFESFALPQDLINYINSNENIILNWVEGPNTKPFKKLLPILKYLDEDDIILHVDDDSIPCKTFVESRIKDFNKYHTCISGTPETFNGYAHGRLPELKHRFGPGTLTQKKMFNNWEKILNDEIIKTNHDDAFYDFMCWLNGYLPENATCDLTSSFEHISDKSPALHGSIGCANADTATDINIKIFKQVYKEKPRYNYFKTNKNPKKYKFVMFDRVRKAGDNAEYFYRWLKENKPEVNISYILNHSSSDWNRLTKEGFNLIDSSDINKVQKEIDNCDFVCFSYFAKNVLPQIDTSKPRQIFLNHGVFYRILSYLTTKTDLFDLMIAGNKYEYNVLLNSYNLPEDKLALTGLPRHDSLVKQYNQYKGDTNNILIQFWWRPWLWNIELFEKSEFYKNVIAFLNDKRLKELSDKYKVNFILKLHCETEKYSKLFNNLKYVKLIDNNALFEPLFLKSSLLITDFTSNVYEMGTINKPCIYFRPDKEDFKQHLIKQDGSYFDVKKEGIGPCVDDINSLFIELDKLLKNKYKLEDVYLNKRKEQIIFANDSNCCERIFKSILESRKWEIINKPKKEEIIVKKENTNHDALPSLKDCSIWFN